MTTMFGRYGGGGQPRGTTADPWSWDTATRPTGFPAPGETWGPEIAGYQEQLSPSQQFQSFLGRVFPEGGDFGYSPMRQRAQDAMLQPSYSAYQLGRVANPNQQFFEYLDRNRMPDPASMAGNLATAMGVSAPGQYQYVKGGTDIENAQRLANEIYLRSLGDPEQQMNLAMAPMLQATAPAMRGGIQGAMDPLMQTFLGGQTTGPAIGGFLNFLRERFGGQFANLFGGAGGVGVGEVGRTLTPTATEAGGGAVVPVGRPAGTIPPHIAALLNKRDLTEAEQKTLNEWMQQSEMTAGTV